MSPYAKMPCDEKWTKEAAYICPILNICTDFKTRAFQRNITQEYLIISIEFFFWKLAIWYESFAYVIPFQAKIRNFEPNKPL